MQDYDGKISVIMPAHNEGEHIGSNLQETIHTLESFGCNYEIVVVDDGSDDNTFDEASRIAVKYDNVQVKRNRGNYGKGRAVKKGFRHVTGNLVVFLDADLDLHPEQVRPLFELLQSKNVDVVIGSKRHPLSQVNYPWQRKIISNVYYYLIRIAFGLPVRDTQTGIKIFRYEVLKKVFPKILIKRYAFDLELLVNVHHFGFHIAEAPITLNFRRPFGRIGLKSIYLTWWDTMAVFYRMYFLHYYDRNCSKRKK